MQLRELQQQFMNGLYQTSPAILEHIDARQRSADDQIGIYRSSVLGGMCKAMDEVYPVCRQLVGDEFFTAMALRYVKETRATSPDLTDYGGTFADFIARFKPAASLPYLQDIVRLEWAWHRAFNAPAPAPADLAQLLSVPATQLARVRLGLAPTAHLLSSAYPVHRIWQMHQPEYRDESVSLDEGGCRLLIWRPALDVFVQPLDGAAWCLLQGAQAGKTLGQIFGASTTAYTHSDMQQALVQSLQEGVFHSYTLSETQEPVVAR